MTQFHRLLVTTLASIGTRHLQHRATVHTKAAATAVSIHCEELKLPCLDGVTLSAQKYTTTHGTQQQPRSTTTKRILCLHGWLDNCRSFYSLAPSILKEYPQAELVALDFPGHGWSHHKSVQSPPMVQAELAFYVQEALHALEWWQPQPDDGGIDDDDDDNECETTPLTLMGHSLGAGVSSLFAAGFPEQVDRLILLEGAGFVARPAAKTAEYARNHIVERRQTLLKLQQQQQQQPSTPATTNDFVPQFNNPKEYPSLQVAIQTRRRAALVLPQKKRKLLPAQVAEELVARSTRPLINGNDGTMVGKEIKNQSGDSSDDSLTATEPTVQFTHDARFNAPSILYMTWDQVQGIFDAITSDVCLLVAEEGWPFDQAQLERTKELLKPVLYKKLPGCHYFHADPETADAVAQAVIQFLRQTDAKAENGGR